MQLNVYQRLNAIKEEISYLQKDKRVGEGGYMAVTHDAVTAHTRALFVKHGVMVIPDETESATIVTTMTTAKGIPFVRFEATYRIRFVNIDAPEEYVGMSVTSHALDHGDKSPGKALSYATKYAVLKMLQLETGEDDESRAVSEVKPVDLVYWRKALNEATTKDGFAAVWKLFSTACKDAGDFDSHNLIKEEREAAKKKSAPQPGEGEPK